MLNLTIYGNVSSAGTNTYLHVYFRKVNGGSTTSKWNDQRIAELATGFYSVNLGDGDFLTQDGIASPGDKVLVVAWVNDPDKQSLLNTGVKGISEITLTSNHFTTGIVSVPVLMQTTTNPVSSLSWADPVRKLTAHYFDNTSHDNEGSSTTGAVTNWRLRTYDGQLLFRTVGIDHCDIAYVDGTTSTVAAADFNLTFTSIGSKSCHIDAYTEDGRSTRHNFAVSVRKRLPVVGATFLPATVYYNTEVTYTPTIQDLDSAITSISTYEDTSGVYELYRTDTPETKNNQSTITPGVGISIFSIRQNISFNDSFSTGTVVGTAASIVVTNTPPVAAFSIDSVPASAAATLFTSGSVDPDGEITGYLWVLSAGNDIDGWTQVLVVSGTEQDTLIYNFVASGHFRMELTVTDSRGSTTSYTQQFDINVVLHKQIIIIPLGED